jgi:hypothetical protein
MATAMARGGSGRPKRGASGMLYRTARTNRPITSPTYRNPGPAGHRTGTRGFRLPPPRMMRRTGVPFADVPNVGAQQQRRIPPTTPMAPIYAVPASRWARQ